MSDFSARFDRLMQRGRRLAAGVRPRHLVIMAGVLVIGVGVAAASDRARPAPRVTADDSRLRIQVVAPVEPPITPGGVMEVGDLVDGFVSPPRTPPATRSDRYAPYDDYAEAPEPSARRPSAGERGYSEGEAVIQAPPQPRAPEDDRRGGRVSRWLGFDAPDRDYRAEREARWARREAREARERERDWARERDREAYRERDRWAPRREYRDDGGY